MKRPNSFKESNQKKRSRWDDLDDNTKSKSSIKPSFEIPKPPINSAFSTLLKVNTDKKIRYSNSLNNNINNDSNINSNEELNNISNEMTIESENGTLKNQIKSDNQEIINLNKDHEEKLNEKLNEKEIPKAISILQGSKPLFISKSEREAIRKLQEEIIIRKMEYEQQNQSLQEKDNLEIAPSHLTTQELEEIKKSYISNEPIKSKKKSKKIIEDWDSKDDTSISQPEIIRNSNKIEYNEFKEVSKSWKDKRLNEMNNRDWRSFREEFEIRTRGKNVPNPIRSWEEANIPDSLKRSIREARYRIPTPIQMQCVPLAFSKRDILGIAETGSGKTAAFVVPMLAQISNLPKITTENSRFGPYALILAPTRELVQQIEREIRKLSKYLDIRVMYVIGGEDIQDQQLEISRGIEILVATPGRLVDLLQTRYISLSQCRYMVMDEADRMCSMNYENDLLTILESMPDNSTQINRRQTVMFSATMPASVEKLASQYLNDRILVSIGEIGRINENIKLITLWVDENAKNKQLYNILQRSDPPIIVFVNERRTVDSLYHYLKSCKFSCIPIHGGKSQNVRESSIQSFRNGNAEILIATDLAGRGIDIEGVTLVINYDMPDDISKFKHRVGRTGRAGAKGKAISFLTEKDTQIMYDLKRILRASNAEIPQELLMADASRAPENVQREAREE